jgi:hypothetical protein
MLSGSNYFMTKMILEMENKEEKMYWTHALIYLF